MKNLHYRYFLGISAGILLLIGGCSKSNSAGGSLYTPTSADVTSIATFAE